MCELVTGAPVTAAFANGGVPTPVEFRPSFIDGAGSGSLLPRMWEHAQPLLSDSFSVTLEDAAAAVRVLMERARIVAEGAAGLTVAAALAGRASTGRVVCIVSGGNIDAKRLAAILDAASPIVDQRPLEPCDRFAQKVRFGDRVRINGEHRAEAQSQNASSAVDVLVDGSVLGEEGIAPLRGQHAPDQREVDRRIALCSSPPSR